MSTKSEQLLNAIGKLRDYLAANHLRLTRERIAILEVMHEEDRPLAIEEVGRILEEKNFHVSTATLYRTAEVLIHANLLLRHPSSAASAMYERVPESTVTCLMVCNHCNRVTPITDAHALAAIEGIRAKRFTPLHRVTYIYGICVPCKTKLRRQLKKRLQETKQPTDRNHS